MGLPVTAAGSTARLMSPATASCLSNPDMAASANPRAICCSLSNQRKRSRPIWLAVRLAVEALFFERIAHQDDVFTLRAGAQERYWFADQLFEPANILDRLAGQLRP